MALFLSTYTNKVDRKGRVSVPATFRVAATKGGDFHGVVLYPVPGEAAIEGSDIGRLDALADQLDDHYSAGDDDGDAIAMALLAEARELSFDADGRITLPADLRDYAGIGDGAVFVGMGKRFKIYAPEVHADQRGALKGRAKDALKSKPPLGARRRD